MLPLNIKEDLTDITNSREIALALTLKQIVLNIAKESEVSQSAAEGFLNNMYAIIREKSEPGAYFETLDEGAFKECYESGIPKWIIKFCSDTNDSGAEEQIIKLASEYGCGDMFIPTYFIDLPFSLAAVELETKTPGMRYIEDEYAFYAYEGGESQRLISCQIQPKVSIVKNSPHTSIEFDDDIDYQIHYNDGSVFSANELCRLDLNCLEWVEDAISAYGDKIFNNFLSFSKLCCLSDLHSGNLGYIEREGKRYPVIIDWLSRKVLEKI